jgi:hypothetical protein
MEVIFGTNVNTIIMDYINLTDIYNLKKLFSLKIYDGYLDKKIVELIDYKLSLIFGDYYDLFKQFLDVTGSLISGSFIIQVLLNKTYKNSDIDIYFPEEASNSLINFARLLGTFINDRQTYSHDFRNKILDVNDLYLNGTKLQFIKMANDKIYDFIMDDFDIDICKNVFGVENEKMYAKIYNLDMLMNKTGNMKTDGIIMKNVDRYLKYTKRGFNIERHEHDKMLKNLIQSTIDEKLVVEAIILSEGKFQIDVAFSKEPPYIKRYGHKLIRGKDRYYISKTGANCY